MPLPLVGTSAPAGAVIVLVQLGSARLDDCAAAVPKDNEDSTTMAVVPTVAATRFEIPVFIKTLSSKNQPHDEFLIFPHFPAGSKSSDQSHPVRAAHLHRKSFDAVFLPEEEPTETRDTPHRASTGHIREHGRPTVA
ncbi:hypothetical protein [Actinopolyspora mortivallis]|uniref:hypothetical protein n=1 Tax=Actinopolyspora mortivallis TaxID=33906 RepID=UPI001FE0B6E9|nr:hypothetical protein [Actinopolyspora mortivallis]